MTGPGPRPAHLVVLLGSMRVGVVEPSRSHADGSAGHRLRYDETWTARPDAYPLSLSLPLVRRVHASVHVTHVLESVLPDQGGERRQALAAAVGVAPTDTFGLLAALGEDCPGAVQLVRPERVAELTDLAAAGPAAITWWTEAELASRLRALRAEGARAEVAVAGGRFSLPGALTKITVVRHPDGGALGIPAAGTPSTHIVKLPLAIPGHLENELLCLRLARATLAEAAEAVIVRAEDEAALLVTRFDREIAPGGVRRLHQEDVLGALGRPPWGRYWNDAAGAPTVPEIAQLLRDHGAAPDVERIVEAVAFNWLIYGTDAHARNYSVRILAGGLARLAPLYDVATALLVPRRARDAHLDTLALPLRVGTAERFGQVTRETWEDLGRSLRWHRDEAAARVREVAERIARAAPEVATAALAEGVAGRWVREFERALVRRAKDAASRL